MTHPQAMPEVDPSIPLGIDRRTFLTWMPRKMLAGVKGLLVAEQGRRLAVIDVPRCLAWGASPCQACYLRCPLRDAAIVLDDGRPLVVASACDGCGVCVEACRTVNDLGAIRLVLDDNLNRTPSPGT